MTTADTTLVIVAWIVATVCIAVHIDLKERELAGGLRLIIALAVVLIFLGLTFGWFGLPNLPKQLGPIAAFVILPTAPFAAYWFRKMAVAAATRRQNRELHRSEE